jgi:hypothetical protein
LVVIECLARCRHRNLQRSLGVAWCSCRPCDAANLFAACRTRTRAVRCLHESTLPKSSQARATRRCRADWYRTGTEMRMRAASATIAPCRDKPGARVPSVSCRPFADSQQHRTNTDIPIHRALPKVTVRNTNAPLQRKVPNLIKDAVATPKIPTLVGNIYIDLAKQMLLPAAASFLPT